MASFDGLERMNALLDLLGHPEQDLRVLHIAGTNGKGSTAVMIASILEEAGYSVGLFMSPHLEDECERIQIWDGAHSLIDKEKLKELKDYVKQTLHKEIINVKQTLHDRYGRLTVFEIYTAAAYLYFAEMKPDYVILETGLGGRLDSTNTIKAPLVSVITQIGLDHTKELGSAIEEIAAEKAGIIKEGVPVVSQSKDDTVKAVIRRIAEEKGSSLIDASDITDKYANYELAMIGEHQRCNAASAIEAIKAAGIEVGADDIERGLMHANLPGRIEILGEGPYWIIDGAHNPDATKALTRTFVDLAKEKNIKRTLVIFGCMQDKNSAHMIQLLSQSLEGCDYASCAVDYSRAETSEKLARIFNTYGRECRVSSSVRDAYEYALGSDYECILVTGSIYLAGEIRAMYMNDAGDQIEKAIAY